jgi:hypothetical protein
MASLFHGFIVSLLQGFAVSRLSLFEQTMKLCGNETVKPSMGFLKKGLQNNATFRQSLK